MTDASAKPGRQERFADGARVLLTIAAVMWVVEVIDSLDNHRLDGDGIQPRNVPHLYGVLAAPFLHESFAHLLGNTVPFVVLGLAIAVSGAARVLAVTAIVVLVSGIGTWLTAPSGSVTVGASGVVFGYATYLISRGIFDHSATELAVGALVAVLFGGALLWGLAPHPGVSWEAHLFGGIGGVLAARILTPARRGPAAAPSPRGP